MARPHNAQTSRTAASRRARPIVERRTLRAAIERRLDAPGPDAGAAADHLLEVFGNRTTIEDEPLDKETRAFLYRLHASGIVQTRTEERRNERGRQWLYFYWVIDPAAIERLAGPREGTEGPAKYQHLHHPAAPPPAAVS